MTSAIACPKWAAQKNGKRIALVGGGPASLTVARDLGPMGYECVVFDQAFHCGPYCCFGAAGGLSAGAVVSPGVVFFFLVLVFDFVFFFGVLGSAAGVWSL